MHRCVIVGGARIEDYELIRGYLEPDDFYIFCDCGLKHKKKLQVEPDLVVGDFDSWEKPRMKDVLAVSEEQALAEHLKTFEPVEEAASDAELIVLPHKKDDTDTVFAVKEGIRRGFDRFLLLGVTGQRLDHTLANVYTLLMLKEQGKQAMIADDLSELVIVGREPVFIDPSFSFFSLISFAGTARHVCIEDALFPLSDGEIHSDYQYAVSNEVLPGKRACVTVGDGWLLLIRVR